MPKKPKSMIADRRPLSTSTSDPIRIAELQVRDGFGKIGITFCPGKVDGAGRSARWDRNLDADLDAIRDWGAASVVTLIEDHEFDLLKVMGLGDGVIARDMSWVHLPIRDVSVPTPDFEERWATRAPHLLRLLRSGRNVLVHCRGGLGRAGMVSCRLLTDLGEAPHEALRRVRAVRPGAVETPAQEDWVLGSQP